eukprot:1634368-Rhodomonas_salina.1
MAWRGRVPERRDKHLFIYVGTVLYYVPDFRGESSCVSCGGRFVLAKSSPTREPQSVVLRRVANGMNERREGREAEEEKNGRLCRGAPTEEESTEVSTEGRERRRSRRRSQQ